MQTANCMKRILIISHSSVVDVYQDKIKELSKQSDLQITLIIPSVYLEGAKLVCGGIGGEGYKVEKLYAIFGKSGRQHLHFYPSLFFTLRRIKPDIIHLEEEPESLVSFETIYLSKFLRPKPTIILFTWRNLEKTHKEWSLLSPQRYVYPMVENYTLKNIDYLIAGNQEGAKIFKKKGYKWPIKVIPQYGVDTNKYKALENAKSLKKALELPGFVVGYVGRLWKPKGIGTLLKAISQIDRKFTLLLLGSGPDRNEYLELAKSLGIDHKIRMVSSVKASDVVKYLNCIDILVLPSETTPEWKEQFGRVLIEAMACEIPVIGSSSGEIPNVIGDTGLIFEEGNEKDLAGKISILMDNSELRQKLGEAGRKRVLENFTNKRISGMLFSVYNEILSNNENKVND
ncbi:MAG: glycosyltransferase family 1 protein [Candidatus Kuenenia stuttgartiensis]|nr:glycosyltransferase family 1 protein [Candidatus Kuenenia stuttgartiensis]